jgi:16S rRNA (cytidine1402-2'-O)-methyltransferase
MLYVVATPIGNLEDTSPRAVRILKEAAAVASEDTRTTRKLLSHFGIGTPLVAFFQHSGEGRLRELVERLKRGESVALVTEAGTPGVSDPGAALVSAALDAGVPVRAVPGPSALAAALSVCGFSTRRVAFDGFLPPKGGKRRKALELLAREERTIVLFESPWRLQRTLADLAKTLGRRRVAVACEISKKFEDVWRGTLEEAAAKHAGKPRGEFTLVVEPVRRPRGGGEEE